MTWKPEIFTLQKDTSSVDKRELVKQYFEQVTPIDIFSLETSLGDNHALEKVKSIVADYMRNRLTKDRIKNSFDFDSTKKKFLLGNGEEILIGDLILLSIFLKNNLYHDASNNLMSISDGGKSTRAIFKDLIDRKDPTILIPNRQLKKKTSSGEKTFFPQSFHYWEVISPTMIKKGFLHPTDFKRASFGSSNYNIFGGHERKITKEQPYVHFSNTDTSSRYYLGRTMFPGTTTKINHDTVTLKALDEKTIAIIDTVHGKRKILFTFPFISEKEFIEKKEKIVADAITNGKNPPENINAYITCDFKEMAERIKPYEITHLIPQKNTETPKEYAEKIAKLSDTTYFFETFPKLIGSFGIGIHTLPFREQLVLADTLTHVHQQDILSDFSKKYSQEGLRTFLSLDHGGSGMGQKIIELGTILEQQDAQRIFDGYAQIINQADRLQNRLDQELKNKDNILESLKEKIPYQIYDALLLRAKDILVGAHMIASKTIEGKLNISDVCNALSGISTMLDILNDLGLEQKYQFQKTLETTQNHKYTVTDPATGYHYGLKLFLRPYAEKNAQARVNIELSFDTDNPNPDLQKVFYNEIISHTQNKTITGSNLRIGIDREDHNGIGRASLDIGRSEHNDDALTRTGDVLGNLLSYASIDGHHTVDPFSPEFGEPELFAQLVELLGQSLVHQK